MALEPGEIHLILSINLDADPINGSLETADGGSRRFSGWIGLAATLHAIRASGPPAGSAATQRGADHSPGS